MAGSRNPRRIDWIATHKRIRRFLAEEVSEFKLARKAKHLITTPKEIARHTGLNVKTVKAHLSETKGRKVDGKVVIIRVDGKEVVVRLR